MLKDVNIKTLLTFRLTKNNNSVMAVGLYLFSLTNKNFKYCMKNDSFKTKACIYKKKLSNQKLKQNMDYKFATL